MTQVLEASPALLLREVRAGYEDHPVLLGVSGSLDAGQAAALLGPNGSGKSTLLKVTLGLLRPWAGQVELFGQQLDRVDRRSRQVGYVPQLREVDRGFPLTVFDLAMMGRVGRLGLFRGPSKHDRELVIEIMERVGLRELAARPFGALSGGQQQRGFLARALAQEPDLLVLDEPMAGVDLDNRVHVGELLENVRARGVPLLVATHDLDELWPLEFDQHWTLVQGALRIDVPGVEHVPHVPDHHEPTPTRPAPRRRPGLFGYGRGASTWG